MAIFTDVLDANYNFPNINIYRRLKDGELSAYIAKAQDGYVFYDTAANNTEAQIDTETGDFVYAPETGLPIEVPVIYYYKSRSYPAGYNMNNFSLVAVPQDEEAENENIS